MEKKLAFPIHQSFLTGLPRPWWARLILLLCLLGCLPGTSHAQAQAPLQLPDDVIVLEHESKLEEALRLLKEDQKVGKIHKKHIEQLEEVLRTFRSMAVYSQLGEYNTAEAELKRLISNLRPQEDDLLLAAVLKKRIELQTEAKKIVDKQARDLIADGDTYRLANLFDKALAAFSQAAGLGPSDELAQNIRKRILDTELANAQSKSTSYWKGIFGNIVSGLKTIFEWLVYIGGALIIVFMLHKLRKFRRAYDKTVITLQDLTIKGQDREAANQLLTQEFLLETRILVGGGASTSDENGEDRAVELGPLRELGTKFSIMPETDPEKGWSTLALISELPSRFSEIDTLIQDGTPVRFGPISFSPRQLFALLSSYFRRLSKYTLVGSLSGGQEGLMLTVERLGLDGKPLPNELWKAVARGADARAEVIRDVAAQAAVKICQISVDWKSLRDYRKALGALSNEPIKERKNEQLKDAHKWLGRSLYFDPSNWIARFNLAIVLHNLGMFEAAIEQLRYLYELAKGDAPCAIPALSLCLQYHPEFEQVIKYNQAVCLTRLSGWGNHNEAVKILKSVVNWTQVDNLPNDPKTLGLYREKARLEMLSLSALASALNFELEQIKHSSKIHEKIHETRYQKRQDEIFGEIKSICDWFQKLPAERIRINPREYTVSSGIVDHAAGRAYHLMGRHADSIKALRRAIAIDPSQVDSYVDLALAHLKTKQTEDWQLQVEENLVQALGLKPFNPKAHYLLGQLYSHPSVAQFEAAKDHFRKAGSSPWGLFQLAMIQGDQDLNYSEAIKTLRKSLALLPQPDIRAQYFVIYALELYKQKQDSKLLKEAQEIAFRLSNNGIHLGLRRKGAELLEEVKKIAPNPQKMPPQQSCTTP